MRFRSCLDKMDSQTKMTAKAEIFGKLLTTVEIFRGIDIVPTSSEKR